MNGNRYKSIRQANILFENRFLINKGILKEYDQKTLEDKRTEIVNKLKSLKEVQKGMFASVKKSKINDYITDLQNVNLSNVCEGVKLRNDLQTKLNDAKQGLEQYKDQIDDPNGLLPGLKADISLIENFCKSEKSDNKSKSNTTTQSTTTSQSQQRMRDENPQQNNTTNQSQSTTTSQSQQNNTTSNLDSLKGMKFMDALNTLNSGENFTKNDIINYVKSKVTIKTT
jgi:hypothetical protein